jgi:hypothetical protein
MTLMWNVLRSSWYPLFASSSYKRVEQSTTMNLNLMIELGVPLPFVMGPRDQHLFSIAPFCSIHHIFTQSVKIGSQGRSQLLRLTHDSSFFGCSSFDAVCNLCSGPCGAGSPVSELVSSSVTRSQLRYRRRSQSVPST